jgi:hypothetical protein
MAFIVISLFVLMFFGAFGFLVAQAQHELKED